MGSREKPVFDLNQAPMDSSEEFDEQKAASSRYNPDTLEASADPCMANNTALSQKILASKSHPFVRTRICPSLENNDNMKNLGGGDSYVPSIPKFSSNGKKISTVDSRSVCRQSVEREEGEWSDGELIADVRGNVSSTRAIQSIKSGKALQEQGLAGPRDQSAFRVSVERSSLTDSVNELARNETNILCAGLNTRVHDLVGSGDCNADVSSEANFSVDGQRDSDAVPKKKESKGTEASYALKCANNIGKKHKLDDQKEAMLGKKRNRQTMFLNLEDVKQVGAVKSSTPKRQSIPPPSSRTLRGSRSFPSPAEHNGEKQNEFKTKDQSQGELSCKEEENSVEPSDCNSEGYSDINAGLLTRSRRQNSSSDLSNEVNNVTKQNLLKQPSESFQAKNAHVSFRKPASVSPGSVGLTSGGNKKIPPKKQTGSSSQYQDTSVERLLREVTSDKLWHNPEDTELQCVPGQFESVEEYVRVFEPLLFEECRAQLFSTWEESTEASSRDSHVVARVKGVERRERGWFDVIIMPVNEIKWMFKEGDVAVLSSSKPGSVRSRRNTSLSAGEDKETEASGRVIGTIRRHIPIDTRDPIGAVLHFYVGDSYDANSSADNDHILRKLQPRDVWFLTILGSLATSQREYIGLHAFCRLSAQMQGAILQPSPEHFPKYEEQSPIIPECFTPNFVEHLHRTFNSPQLAAIQWAATHTAAGTNGMTRKQDPWPFTLVQGPPGTGKTHTVWGMLNVIHLVQYQHYYNALLKKLAPDSYKLANENNASVVSGSIDEVLQNMDQNLFRTLPKLCPKPRMLVCAPSNAATDELLARVLDRGFIDGEMKMYRPDVARVGVDSQSRAAQAVSVERRTEQLLVKSREEVYGWLQQLKVRENHLSMQIANLQRQLVVSAAAGRSQGSVGVDPDVLMARDQNRDTLLQNLAAVVEGRDKVLVEMSRLLILESRFRPGSGFNLEEARASLEASFANEAEVVFTTLSSSGRKLFSRLTHGFDMVVIDEAAQASEMAVLPPLSLGAARCVLVGDPQQLPATVISKAAGILQYSRSLFERFQQAGCPSMESHKGGSVSYQNVMGNANALIQSDDWAALIADAKGRNCYMDLDSLPKEFQISKAPSFPSSFPHIARGTRSSGGPRPRLLDMPAEFKPGSSSERVKQTLVPSVGPGLAMPSKGEKPVKRRRRKPTQP
ncbi:hypothetical protein V2J09_000102 [Rumex salicifolius]